MANRRVDVLPAEPEGVGDPAVVLDGRVEGDASARGGRAAAGLAHTGGVVDAVAGQRAGAAADPAVGSGGGDGVGAVQDPGVAGAVGGGHAEGLLAQGGGVDSLPVGHGAHTGGDPGAADRVHAGEVGGHDLVLDVDRPGGRPRNRDEGAGGVSGDVEHEDRVRHRVRCRPHPGVGTVADEQLLTDHLHGPGVAEAQAREADAGPSRPEGPARHRRPVETVLLVDRQQITGYAVEVDPQDLGEPGDREPVPQRVRGVVVGADVRAARDVGAAVGHAPARTGPLRRQRPPGRDLELAGDPSQAVDGRERGVPLPRRTPRRDPRERVEHVGVRVIGEGLEVLVPRLTGGGPAPDASGVDEGRLRDPSAQRPGRAIDLQQRVGLVIGHPQCVVPRHIGAALVVEHPSRGSRERRCPDQAVQGELRIRGTGQRLRGARPDHDRGEQDRPHKDPDQHPRAHSVLPTRFRATHRRERRHRARYRRRGPSRTGRSPEIPCRLGRAAGT